jgi:hypothetical protein
MLLCIYACHDSFKSTIMQLIIQYLSRTDDNVRAQLAICIARSSSTVAGACSDRSVPPPVSRRLLMAAELASTAYCLLLPTTTQGSETIN